MLESRLMLEGENGMFTGVAVEFTCPNAALPRAHDAPATVGLLADVSHSKRCERVRHRKRRLRASGAPVGLPVDGRSDGWLIGNGRVAVVPPCPPYRSPRPGGRNRLRAMGIRDRPIAPRSPWENGRDY